MREGKQIITSGGIGPTNRTRAESASFPATAWSNPVACGRERRERLSQLASCGGGCFDSRRVNSTVMPEVKMSHTRVAPAR